MRLFRASRLFTLTGLIAFCAFTGDLVTDSISEACCEQHSSQTSPADRSHEKAPCSSCSCAVHNGSAIASTNAVHVVGAQYGSHFLFAIDPSAPEAIPPAIDHPPQLA